MTLGFHVSTDNCYGCKTCTVGCANEHLLASGVYLRRVRQIERDDAVGHAFVSMSCNHCDEPACLANCPVGAYEKNDDGLVIQDHDKCIGCQTCVQVCPFHAPAYCEGDSTTYKCDGCIDRLNAGLEPVCTVVCPSMNIAMGEFDSLLSSHEGAVSIKDFAETKPNFAATLDPDITDPASLAAIDEYAETVDRGGEGY